MMIDETGEDQTGVAMQGIDTVAQALRFEDFPTDKQNLYYSIGDIEIENGVGAMVPVRDVLELVPEERFTTARDALQAICRAAQRHGFIAA